jgi:hypothetical protein
MFLASHRTHRFRRSIALVLLLVLLVVGLGLPHLMLVCNQACCDGRVALARSCGLQERASERAAASAEADECPCCRRAREATSDLGGQRAVDGGGCRGCEHRALSCELGLPQAFELPDVPTTEPRYLPASALRMARPAGLAAALPPATGPPRPDPRTRLLATTLLRI